MTTTLFVFGQHSVTAAEVAPDTGGFRLQLEQFTQGMQEAFRLHYEETQELAKSTAVGSSYELLARDSAAMFDKASRYASLMSNADVERHRDAFT